MIDVSAYQGEINWHQVAKSGVARAFIKATEGAVRTDARLIANAAAARAEGVQIGFYHYGHPASSPTAEAKHFLSVIDPLMRPGDLPPVLDLEITEGHDGAYLNDWKAQWLALVDAAVPCTAEHSTVFYSYYYFLKGMVLYPDRPVWGAAYGATFTPPEAWSVWQYSSSGRVPGITGLVDLDKPLKDLPTVT